MTSGVIVGYHFPYVTLVYKAHHTGDTQCPFWDRVLSSNVLNIATGGVLAWVNIGNGD